MKLACKQRYLQAKQVIKCVRDDPAGNSFCRRKTNTVTYFIEPITRVPINGTLLFCCDFGIAGKELLLDKGIKKEQ